MATVISKVTVDKVEASLKEGLGQAQVRQVISRSYATAKVSNDLKDSFFSNAELKIEDGKPYEEVRVAWIEVPKDFTKAQVEAHLATNFPDMTLYRILSSKIILSSDQQQVVANGLSGSALDSFNEKYKIAEGTVWGREHLKFFLGNIADRQAVRYGEGNTEGKSADELVMFNGKPQYRRVEASTTKREDLDLRERELVMEEAIDLAPTANAVIETAKA